MENSAAGGTRENEGQEDAEMENEPLADGIAGKEDTTIVVDDYRGDLSSEDENEEGIYSENEDLPRRKRQKRGADGAEKEGK